MIQLKTTTFPPAKLEPWQVFIQRGNTLLSQVQDIQNVDTFNKPLYAMWLKKKFLDLENPDVLTELLRLYDIHNTYGKLELIGLPKEPYIYSIKDILELSLVKDCYRLVFEE